MIQLVHATGNSFVRAALDAFYDEEILASFTTSVATFDGNCFDKLSRSKFGQELNRRRYRNELASLTHQSPFFELTRLLANKAGIHWLTQHEQGPFCVDRVFHQLDRRATAHLRKHANSIKATYAYEDGAMAQFEAGKALGKINLYDLPIGYWRSARKIQSEEAELKPEWADTMPALVDSEQKVARKDQELQLADAIIVASSFTANTLKDAPFKLPEPVVIPYGCPEVDASLQQSGGKPATREHKANNHQRPTNNQTLRVLFVGGLSQRKGVSYLFDAVDALGSAVELTVIGRKPSTPCKPLVEGLNQCRYISSLPHDQILKEMREHDVLVFPSLFEGFGLVVTEALSQGMMVITTAHTCGPDILTDGVDGFIVPIRSCEAISEKLNLLQQNPKLLQDMKAAALETAKRVTWKAYRDQLAIKIKSIIQRG